MLDTKTLNQLIFDAFAGKTTFLEASQRYTLDEFIEAFSNARSAMKRTIADVNDVQAAYQDSNSPIWSLSETITHLIHTQGLFHNNLLDITTSRLPHVIEAARGRGEGARQSVSADELRKMLDEATVRIFEVIAQTRNHANPDLTTRNAIFGEMNYQTWILAMLSHEVDHIRQAIVMRRLAKAAT